MAVKKKNSKESNRRDNLKRKPRWVRVNMYRCDWYNLHLLTKKLTCHTRPSRAATLHALLQAACPQHGIDALEEEDFAEGKMPPGCEGLITTRVMEEPNCTRGLKRMKKRSELRLERILDVPGPTRLDLKLGQPVYDHIH